MTTTLPPGPTRNPGGFGIDPRLGAATLRAPAASKEDIRPQAILKFQPRISFDYRVLYEPHFKPMVLAMRVDQNYFFQEKFFASSISESKFTV